MGWLLALDTSTPITALALGRDGALVAAAEHDDRARPGSELLGPRIAALLAEAGVRPRELAAVACGVGPGTFTGTRVAVATAKGLAFALPCPLFAVSTLAAIAAGAAADGPVLATIDARRGEVYAALFAVDAGGPAPRGPERCCPLEQVLSDMSEVPGLQVVGSGAPASGQPMPGVAARGLWRAAVRAARGEAADVATSDATYLRASYAELGVNTPRQPPVRSPFA